MSLLHLPRSSVTPGDLILLSHICRWETPGGPQSTSLSTLAFIPLFKTQTFLPEHLLSAGGVTGMGDTALPSGGPESPLGSQVSSLAARSLGLGSSGTDTHAGRGHSQGACGSVVVMAAARLSHHQHRGRHTCGRFPSGSGDVKRLTWTARGCGIHQAWGLGCRLGVRQEPAGGGRCLVVRKPRVAPVPSWPPHNMAPRAPR